MGKQLQIKKLTGLHDFNCKNNIANSEIWQLKLTILTVILYLPK